MLTAAMNRVRRVRASADAGVSLPELMMAMVLSAILGAVTLVLFIDVNNATSTTSDRAINAAKARTALQAWTSYLQVSDGPTAGSALNRFEWIGPTNVLFYSDLYGSRLQTSLATTGAPTLVWLRLDGTGQLVEEQFSPIPSSFPATAKTCRLLGGGVSAAKLFTPYGSTGSDLSALNLGTVPSASSGCQPLAGLPSKAQHPDQAATANLQTVFSVGIDFTVSDTKHSHPIEFNAVVALPVLAGAA
jgi:prepilin-type N-terminal cleavage/methylation domain-containing protein